MLRKAMSSIMRCRSGEICLVIAPVEEERACSTTTLTARLRRRGRRPWPGPCRRGYLVRHVRNGSVEPLPPLGSLVIVGRSKNETVDVSGYDCRASVLNGCCRRRTGGDL